MEDEPCSCDTIWCGRNGAIKLTMAFDRNEFANIVASSSAPPSPRTPPPPFSFILFAGPRSREFLDEAMSGLRLLVVYVFLPIFISILLCSRSFSSARFPNASRPPPSSASAAIFFFLPFLLPHDSIQIRLETSSHTWQDLNIQIRMAIILFVYRFSLGSARCMRV